MSVFDRLAWNLATAEIELAQFKIWLAGQTYVGEKAIVAEITSRPHMCGLLAAVAGFSAPDLIKPELQLKGLFRTDLVLGNSVTRQFALIEFEDAEVDSIFRKTKNKAQYRPWSSRLEHGFGQIVDWAWLKSDAPNDIVLTSAFGGKIVASAFLVIAGRDEGIAGEMEERRYLHRTNDVSIAGVPARVLTYDKMVAAMELNLITAKSWT